MIRMDNVEWMQAVGSRQWAVFFGLFSSPAVTITHRREHLS